MSPDVIAIVGPTASGKSAIAEELALRLGSSVVSADSMQVYRGMDIGTAKTPPAERKVPLLCVDIVDPQDTFSVAEYAVCAHRSIDELVDERKRTAVVCGGTGLYVRAALEDMQFPRGEQVNNPVRERYRKLAEEIGAQALHDRLRDVDPESAALIHPHNVRRVIRAFELHEQGLSYAEQHKGLHEYDFRRPTLMVGLDMPRDMLYERINARVDQMVERGLVDEVSSLVGKGLAQALTSRQAIGYKEIIEALSSSGDRDEAIASAIETIKTRSRRYAKRQLTWFRADPRVTWMPYHGEDPARAAGEILRLASLDGEQKERGERL